MADNFYRTAERSLCAAEALDGHCQDHSHMTCYLAGYVVECAGKEIAMRIFQCNPAEVGKLFSHKVSKISEWLNFIALNHPPLAHIPAGCWPEFAIDAPTILNGPNNWDPGNRYSDNCGWNSAQRACFLSEARCIMQKLTQLLVSGII